MKALSLYSGGCDGLSLAGSWVGIEAVAFCECDTECRKQISRRHPDKPIFEYDTEVTCDALRNSGIEPAGIDIILASPPCQCASVAGARLGDADERNRWPQCLDIVCRVKPRWFMAENVPGLLSVNDGRLFGDILRRLAEMGYDAGWGVWGAADVGAPHKRDRLCLVAYRNDKRQSQPQGDNGEGGGRIVNGCEVADTTRTECHRSISNSHQTRHGGFADSCVMGDSKHDGCSSPEIGTGVTSGNDCEQERQNRTGQSARSGRQYGNVGDSSGAGLQKCDASPISDEPRYAAGERHKGNVGDAGRRSVRYDSTDIGSTPRKIHEITSASALGDTECSGLSGNIRCRSEQELEDGHTKSGCGATQPGLGSLFNGVFSRLAAQQWPSGRGAEQFSWEPPRVVEGMKGRAAQIKMYGNAVVPQWALIILAAIVEFDRLLQLRGTP